MIDINSIFGKIDNIEIVDTLNKRLFRKFILSNEKNIGKDVHLFHRF